MKANQINHLSKRKPRTMIERAKAIFKLIREETEAFPKSNLKKINLNPKDAENWLNLITFIQSQPKIEVSKTGRNMNIEKLENKYLTLCRKNFMDRRLDSDKRLAYIRSYFEVLLIQERLLGPEVDIYEFIWDLPELTRPKVVRMK